MATTTKQPVPSITVTITDERIIAFFKDKNNDWIHPIKFIEKQILLGIEKASQNGMSNTNDHVGSHPPPPSEEVTPSEMEYKEFYKEYTDFIHQKNSLIQSFKDNLKLMENIRFENLEKSLSKKFPLKIESHKCDICNTRSFRNIKALSTHKRKCARVFAAASAVVDENDDLDDDDVDSEEI
jgi:hypothetical protein